jgi:hypothetical protein
MGAPMDEAEAEEDPLALIVAALRDATEAARAAAASAEAAQQAARETQDRVNNTIPGLEKAVAALAKQSRDRVAGLEKAFNDLAQSLRAMTPRRDALHRARQARYAWAVGGLLIGMSFCAALLFLLAAAELHFPR